MALKDKKPVADFKPDDAIADGIRRLRESDGTVPCAAALRFSVQAGVKAAEVGRTLDALSIHLSRCQLGLFGYPGRAKGWADAEAIPENVLEEMRTAGDSSKRITCLALWEFASRHKMSRLRAGLAADRAGLKIVACQLGAF